MEGNHLKRTVLVSQQIAKFGPANTGSIFKQGLEYRLKALSQ